MSRQFDCPSGCLDWSFRLSVYVDFLFDCLALWISSWSIWLTKQSACVLCLTFLWMWLECLLGCFDSWSGCLDCLFECLKTLYKCLNRVSGCLNCTSSYVDSRSGFLDCLYLVILSDCKHCPVSLVFGCQNCLSCCVENLPIYLAHLVFCHIEHLPNYLSGPLGILLYGTFAQLFIWLTWYLDNLFGCVGDPCYFFCV